MRSGGDSTWRGFCRKIRRVLDGAPAALPKLIEAAAAEGPTALSLLFPLHGRFLMTPLLMSCVVFGLVFAGAILGMALQRRLRRITSGRARRTSCGCPWG